MLLILLIVIAKAKGMYRVFVVIVPDSSDWSTGVLEYSTPVIGVLEYSTPVIGVLEYSTPVILGASCFRGLL